MRNHSTTDFASLSDEQLVFLAQKGSDAAQSTLLDRSMPTVKYLVQNISNSDTVVSNEDLYQEAMIGVFAAIKSYDSEKGASFKTYASRCASNSIVSVLRKTKRSVFTVPILDETDDGSNIEINPEALLLADESYKRFLSLLQSELSEKELLVLGLYLCGNSYEKIGKKLMMSAKSVDNALFRARQKIKNLR